MSDSSFSSYDAHMVQCIVDDCLRNVEADSLLVYQTGHRSQLAPFLLLKLGCTDTLHAVQTAKLEAQCLHNFSVFFTIA